MAGVKFSALKRIPRNGGGFKRVLSRISPFFVLAGLICLMVALARPRSNDSVDKDVHEVISISMALDVSGSMENVDMNGEDRRIDIVKRFFRDFVEKRENDLISLVRFGAWATTVVPLTDNHEIVKRALKFTDINRTDSECDGTAIGDALSMALLRLEGAETKTKIVILLSDGDSNSDIISPDNAALCAAKMGVKVYAIGVGKGYATDWFGRRIKTYDDETLRKIAETTGGRFFRAEDSKALEHAMEEIDKLEKTPVEIVYHGGWSELYAPWLIGGVSILMLGFLLSLYSTRRFI